jgi:hypothetical protein
LSILKTPSARSSENQTTNFESGCALVSRIQGCRIDLSDGTSNLYRLMGKEEFARLAQDPVEVILGSTPFIPVMQTADFGHRNDLADGLYRTGNRITIDSNGTVH